jgi:hypothetical protein
LASCIHLDSQVLQNGQIASVFVMEKDGEGGRKEMEGVREGGEKGGEGRE